MSRDAFRNHEVLCFCRKKVYPKYGGNVEKFSLRDTASVLLLMEQVNSMKQQCCMLSAGLWI